MQAVEQHAEDIATFMKCIPGVMTFVLLGYMCISLILDYRTWIVFCKGSAPGWNNPQGYCLFRLQLFYLMLVGDKGPRDTSALREYKDQKARLSLKEARMGSRPMMIPWLLPQRQTGPYDVPADWRAKIKDALADVVEDFNHGQLKPVVFKGISRLEGGGPALLMADGPVPFCRDSQIALREVAHIHSQDASLHVLLAPTDAIEAIETGWQNDSQGPAGTV